MNGRALAVAGALAASVLLTPPALAAPAGTTHPDSINVHGAVDTFSDTIPCHEELGGYLITVTYNGQVHSTVNDNGVWVTSTETGVFTARAIEVETAPDGTLVRDPDHDNNLIPILDAEGQPITRPGESFTGKVTDWYGESINPHESVATFTSDLRGSGTAGTTFSAHENTHLVTAGGGDPLAPDAVMKNAFDHARCG